MEKLIEKQVIKRVKGEARKRIQMVKAKLSPTGAEILDEQPLFAEIGSKAPPSMNDRIRAITQQVQAETAAKLAAQNLTEEDIQRILDEEDDFNIPEEFDTRLTQYELQGVVSELDEAPYLVEEAPISSPESTDAIASTGGEATAEQA